MAYSGSIHTQQDRFRKTDLYKVCTVFEVLTHD